MTVYDTMPSPVGELLLVAEDEGLTRIAFDVRQGHRPDAAWLRAAEHAGPASDVLAAARAQLDAYFAGTLRAFSLPLVPRGTPFQERVWSALAAVRFGETITYSELARRVDAPGAVRAVGRANGANPLPLVLPCHRVIGADGALTGFGGGIERKRWLLAHEGAVLL
jgi:methylated-DNA-[protein]-cysteine S-methyltransferase